MLILHCEDSLEGIFTAIYDAFVYKKQMQQPYRDDIEIAMGEGCLTLFAEEQEVVVDAEKVEKTVRKVVWDFEIIRPLYRHCAILRKIGQA